MEKYGTTNEDILKELKQDYQKLKEQEARLIKTGSTDTSRVISELEAVKKKIDELEAQS